MVRCFEADWEHSEFVPHPESLLIWCPNNGRQRIAHFIDEAKETLWVQNERYQDTVIIERLVRAARRGVKVHVLAKPPHTLKADKLIEGVGGLRILQDVGVKVHTLKHLKLHAKMLLADSKRAIIGSINLAPGSFDARRELAIETDYHHAVKRLEHTARHDWDLSHELDLSDAALLKDLNKREGLKSRQTRPRCGTRQPRKGKALRRAAGLRARGVMTGSLEMAPGLLAASCAKAYHPRLAVLHWDKSWMPDSAGMTMYEGSSRQLTHLLPRRS